MRQSYANAGVLRSVLIIRSCCLSPALRARLLFRAARLAHKRTGAPAALPPLLFLTDPQRCRDPVTIASRLPRGAGVVLRSFGAADALQTARMLSRVCRRRGLALLIGADARLARRSGAQGVHLPERMTIRPALCRHGMITAAAHSQRALQRAARCGAQAALLSPVFPSKSPSAKSPLGRRQAGAMARCAGLPVYALGGINLHRLPVGPFCGFAVIEALL